MVAKNIKCLHYTGDGYFYDLLNTRLWLCEKCKVKLQKEIKYQEELEQKLKGETKLK